MKIAKDIVIEAAYLKEAAFLPGFGSQILLEKSKIPGIEMYWQPKDQTLWCCIGKSTKKWFAVPQTNIKNFNLDKSITIE